MEIVEVDSEAMKMLANLLGLLDEKCYYCKKKVDIENNCGGIMPHPKNNIAIIVCKNTLCLVQYLTDLEDR